MKANTLYWILAFVAMGLFIVEYPSNRARARENAIVDAKIVTLDSRILGERRVLRVSVPDSHETIQHEYPVLYLLGGSDTHFSEAAHSIENLSSLGQLPEMIVVGIRNTADWRPLGLTPMRFAPGLISTEQYSETGCAITPDWKEFYFTRSGGGLRYPTTFVSRFGDDKWTQPEEAPFAGFGPDISPDGKKVIVSQYGSNEGGERTVGLWFADREQEGWSDLEYHGPGSRPSISGSYNLYYVDRSNEEDRGVIVMQRLIDGEYGKPEIVGGGVNTPHYDAHPCIAEHEDYIIFDSDRPGGYGEGDLYICFRDDDDSWGNAINLGPAINKQSHEAYASISPDGEYLFFSSDRGGGFDLYWVDLDIVEKARR